MWWIPDGRMWCRRAWHIPAARASMWTSGSPECARQALQLARRGGTVVYVSYYPSGSTLEVPLFEELIFRELTIKGAQLAQNSWVQALSLFPKMDLRPLISRVYPLERY